MTVPRYNSTTAVQLAVVFLGVFLACWYFWDLPWTTSRVFGAVLAIPALSLWLLARIQLGRSFAVRAQARELVTHGLYSKIRNPIYFFGSLFIAGLILVIGKPIWLLILVVLVPVQAIRARKEARVLEEKFGDAYREYRSRTWF
ncbi:MAG: isoprenylcysteine carboxylmethyltransferase family protein [Bryobacteraceae bacterium]